MSKNVTWLAMILLIAAAGWFGYQQWKAKLRGTYGAVHCVENCETPREEPAEAEIRHPDADSATSVDHLTGAQPGPARGDNRSVTDVKPTKQEAILTQSSASDVTAMVPAGLLSADSLPADAPNNLRFGGSGKFQWYRQGNLTWRLDTATGRSCVVYATISEWRKSIVAQHGCATNS